ncbi:hypothetical protein [Aureimonas sp. AU4]|uniref:hypothetical protein n=1 Tax=Aureimonas sp. AU4 TaxID=1638163 RepID=UPI000780AE33|nr:hypothetical protein [Aureimonas sp. AU4]
MLEIVGETLAQQNAWTLTYEWVSYLWFVVIFTLTISRGSRLSSGLFGRATLALVIAFPRASYFAVGMLFAGYPLRLDVAGVTGPALIAFAMALLY